MVGLYSELLKYEFIYLMLNRRRSRSRASHTDKTQRLRAEQKCDIAQREIEEIKNEKTKHEDESEKIVDNYKVSNFWLLFKNKL